MNANLTERDCHTLLARLTDRQREVLRLMVTGSPTKQIADELGLSESTVKVHRERIYSRLQVVSCAHAAYLAGKGGLI